MRKNGESKSSLISSSKKGERREEEILKKLMLLKKKSRLKMNEERCEAFKIVNLVYEDEKKII